MQGYNLVYFGLGRRRRRRAILEHRTNAGL